MHVHLIPAHSRIFWTCNLFEFENLLTFMGHNTTVPRLSFYFCLGLLPCVHTLAIAIYHIQSSIYRRNLCRTCSAHKGGPGLDEIGKLYIDLNFLILNNPIRAHFQCRTHSLQYCRRRIKCPSENPWFHLWGLWGKNRFWKYWLLLFPLDLDFGFVKLHDQYLLWTDKETNWQTDEQTDRQMSRLTCSQKDRQTDRLTCSQMDGQTDRLTCSQMDR